MLLSKIEKAIKLLREFEPPEGYWVAFSGGKDSVVIYDLVKKAKVKYEAYYCNTTVDPPELRIFLKKQYPEVRWWQPKYSMFELIERKRMLPTRKMRWCCYYLKEVAGKGRVRVTGVRAEESTRRKKRKPVEISSKFKNTKYIHPIFDWTTEEVWEYIHKYSLPYCPLYDEGFDRIGCIGCPLKTKQKLLRDMKRYPYIFERYKKALAKAFKEKPNKYFGSNVDLYLDWWLSQKSLKEWAREKGINLFYLPQTEFF